MAYVTLEELRAHILGNSGSTPEDEVLLQGFLDSAQQYIEGETDRVFEAAADETRYVDYDDFHVRGRTLYLDYDLCQITSVVNGDGVALAPSEYVTVERHKTPWYALTIKSNVAKVWTYSGAQEGAIAITGRWAYSITADAAVKQAVKRLAAWLYRQKDTHNDLVVPVAGQSGVLIVPSSLPKDVQSFIESRLRH
jgi:hypothetical protein